MEGSWHGVAGLAIRVVAKWTSGGARLNSRNLQFTHNKRRHTAAFGGWTRHYVARLCGERYDASDENVLSAQDGQSTHLSW
jgi:hypothetical protein